MTQDPDYAFYEQPKDSQELMHNQFTAELRYYDAHVQLSHSISSMEALLRFYEHCLMRNPTLERALAEAAMNAARLVQATVNGLVSAASRAGVANEEPA